MRHAKLVPNSDILRAKLEPNSRFDKEDSQMRMARVLLWDYSRRYETFQRFVVVLQTSAQDPQLPEGKIERLRATASSPTFKPKQLALVSLHNTMRQVDRDYGCRPRGYHSRRPY